MRRGGASPFFLGKLFFYRVKMHEVCRICFFKNLFQGSRFHHNPLLERFFLIFVKCIFDKIVTKLLLKNTDFLKTERVTIDFLLHPSIHFSTSVTDNKILQKQVCAWSLQSTVPGFHHIAELLHTNTAKQFLSSVNELTWPTVQKYPLIFPSKKQGTQSTSQ